MSGNIREIWQISLVTKAGSVTICMVQFWVFSNKPAGHYERSIWDTQSIFRTHRWYFGEDNPNALNVKARDRAVARIYNDSYVATFRCASQWVKDKSQGRYIGYIRMADVDRLVPPLPQWLVIDELSNTNVRNKIIRIKGADFDKILWAQSLYKKLGGQSPADGKIVLLERGLENVLKHNLASLGLTLADKKLGQQFRMAVGRSDLICIDKAGDFWVIEIKRSQQPSLEVVGQVNKYRGWLQDNVARRRQRVHAMIVCGGADQDLIYACRGSGVELRTFKIPA